MSCPFCNKIEHKEFVLENPLAVAVSDAYPLTRGHSLILPRRHESDYFKLNEAEETAIWSLVRMLRDQLEVQLSPQGYNLGVNVGAPAGQTIEHVHLHLIPRYTGDVEDPRGGIRWIIPAKAAYWTR